MRMLPLFVGSTALLLAVMPIASSYGQDPNSKRPGTEEGAVVEQANTELDAVYKRLMSKLDADGQKALKDAERSWIKWRDDEALLIARGRRYRWQQFARGFFDRPGQVNSPANGSLERILKTVCRQLRPRFREQVAGMSQGTRVAKVEGENGNWYAVEAS